MADRIVILSGKGGAGKSTVSVLVGKSLAAAGKRVLLVDADVGLNSLDILLGTENKNVGNWGDAFLGRSKAADCVFKCEKNLSLLSAPTVYSGEYSPEGFYDIIMSLDGDYDYILIDGPAGIGGGMRLAAAPVSKALLLSAPDDVSVRGCAKAAESVLNAGPSQTRLIINRFRFKAVKKCRQINIDSVIDRAGVRLIGIIPEDKNLWYFGSCGALPRQVSSAIEACERIAARLAGLNIPLDLRSLK